MRTILGPDRHPRPPRERPPAGTIDCHAHIFAPVEQYPFAESRPYTPEPCTFEDYRDLRAVLGVDRAVIVQPAAYGTDNRATLDAIDRAQGRFRGVALIDERTTESDLDHLDRHLIRGIRLTTAHPPGFDALAVMRAAQRVGPRGWHVQLHFGRSMDLLDVSGGIEQSPAPIVIDHLAGCGGEEGIASPAFRRLLSLLRAQDHVWVKVASFYRRTRQPSPYADMHALIRAVVDARPDRVVWGTNWPHPSLTSSMPNDGDLLDVVMHCIPDASLRERVFVRNPEALYGFSAWAAQ